MEFSGFWFQILIALDAEDASVGSNIDFVEATIRAALKLEEAGGAALLEVGLLQNESGDFGLGGGEDIRGDFVFRDVVVEVIVLVAGGDGNGLRGGASGEECRGGGCEQEGGGFFHSFDGW